MAYEPREVYAHISKLNPDLSDGQHDAEEALSLLLNAMHDEIVALCKKAGYTNSGTTSGDQDQMGDGWQTTSKSGKAIRPSITIGRTTFDESPISAGFRGISHSSIKVTGHPSPPPTEQPFFTLQLDMGMPFSSSIDDVIKLVPKEEALDDYKLKDGRVVTVGEMGDTLKWRIFYTEFRLIEHFRKIGERGEVFTFLRKLIQLFCRTTFLGNPETNIGERGKLKKIGFPPNRQLKFFHVCNCGKILSIRQNSVVL